MKNYFIFLIFSSSLSFAALPPKYQNEKDLRVMNAFVQKHPKVKATLKNIDIETKVISFSENCEAVFGRKFVIRPPGWVGPAAALEFKKSNCEIE